MLQRFLLVAASCPALLHASSLHEYGHYTTVEGDIQVETDVRGAATLGGTPSSTRDKFWPGGRFRYYIESKFTNPDNPGTYLIPEDDERIAGAIAHYEEKTCFRFERCATEDACEKPYIRFISDKTKCSSPVGRKDGGVNQINLKETCSIMGIVHEIGHTAGMTHEQSRKDRDNYIIVVKDQISGNHYDVDYAKNGENGRDILPYNYDSILHYQNGAFAIGDEPTIIAPQDIGQRKALSKGDVDAMHFLYNDCSETYAKPICVASVVNSQLIPHSKGFKVEFNGQYEKEKTMTVNYDSTDAPATMMTYDKPAGTDIGNTGYVYVTFTPDASEAGKTRDLSVTFTGSDGPAVTCTITVKVADSANVCLGVPASDPKVCSGRGTCTDDPIMPCDCFAGFGGRDCSGSSECPKDYFYSFDTDVDGWFAQKATVMDPVNKAVGGGSLKVGELPSTGGGGHLGLPNFAKPKSISFFFRMMLLDDQPKVFFRRENGDDCFSIRVIGSADKKVFYAAGTSARDGPTVVLGKFYDLKLDLDWDATTFSLFVDGNEALTDLPFDRPCAQGMTNVAAFGYMWLDEFQLHCLDTPEMKDECEAMPCGMGQTCNDPLQTVMSLGDFECVCTNGEKATGAPAACEKDECAAVPAPCGAGQMCKDPNTEPKNLKDFVCTCANGVTATGVPAACEKDECKATPCEAGQTCNDPDKDATTLKDFVCTCTNGVKATGAPAVCEKDECAGNPCGDGQTCADPNKAANAKNDFTCTCDNDAAIKATGAPVRVCVDDECARTPCAADQMCIDPNTSPKSSDDFVCKCTAGAMTEKVGGPAVCMAGMKDECEEVPSPCGTQTCTDPDQNPTSKKDFICSCANGVKATGAPAVCEKDECAGNPCGDGQTCADPNKAANAKNDFTCTCDNDAAIKATGAPVRVCVDDECARTPCAADQMCIDPNTSPKSSDDFVCKCTAGAMTEKVGGPAVCMAGEEDECEEVPSPCGTQTCTDPDQNPTSKKDFICSCANGVKATGAPAVCEKDECAGNPCGTKQTCADPNKAADKLHDFTCTCDVDATIS
eukprot:Rhum_TRINITY_DN14541_c0_g1::Rhum_TRINITY_DN14541_c0_g1_i5::g.96345::m.96345